MFAKVSEFLPRTFRSLLFGFLTMLTMFATAVANFSKSAPAFGVPKKANVVYKRAARTREWRAPPTPYVFEHVVFNNANRYY
jgi:hypothetical protein